jgi:hypothetical protein
MDGAMHCHSIATVINFCSNDSRFIKACLDEASHFSKQIVVPVCDHFFDGTPENRELLEEIYAAFPDCLFIEYPYIPSKIPKRIWKKIGAAHFWHSFSRLVGYMALDEEVETVLFLDADEIPDGRRFAEWLDESDYQQHQVLKLANYWYFRDPENQSLHWEDSAVLVKKRAVAPHLLLSKEERNELYDSLPGPKRRLCVGADGLPLVHHYSWVRTKDEMLKKVQAWGHKADRNWVELVEKEFQGPFQGTDFVHGYKYQRVEPPFPMGWEGIEKKSDGVENVRRLTAKQVRALVERDSIPLVSWIKQLFGA